MSYALDAAVDRARALRIPASVHIDLLHRCDLDCIHCYLADHRPPGLPTERLFRLLDELAEAQVLHLVVSGGEALLHPDALPLLRQARELRFAVKLVTHAGRVTEPVADELAELGLAEVGVSLYSLEPAHHEAITRVAGSHARTILGIRRLRERGVPVQVKCLVMPENRDSWREVQSWAAELGCNEETSALVHARTDCDSAHVVSRNVEWTERVAVARRALDLALARDGAEAWDPAVAGLADDPPCDAGVARCYVHPSGKVFPCATLWWEVGDLTRASFREVWEGSERLSWLRSLTRDSLATCRGCDYLGGCSCCLALRLQASNDLLGPAPLLCAETHAMYAAAADLGLHDGPPIAAFHPPELAGPGSRDTKSARQR